MSMYKHETAKQELQILLQFPLKIYHSVSRNSVYKPASAQKSVKIILKPAKST